MMSARLGQGLPWTEDDLLALGEAPGRVELFDGSLFVTPGRTPSHQHVSFELKRAMRSAARDAGLCVPGTVHIRLRTARITTPDAVITDDLADPVIDADAVRLVCEIASPWNAAGKVLKMHYYAAAGIPWYLLVEQEAAALRLHRLEGRHYVEHSVTPSGGVLRLEEPFEARIDTRELLAPR